MNAARRAVRIFVSSTFRDLFAEREELVKRVFPQLRKLCEQRGVAWGEVDLRWGITEEQAERGDVLPVCLAEIDRCRPFFLGILGERYGWVPGPDRLAAEVLEDHPWLREHLDDSVTEMEICHGVLNHAGQPLHAFFYFRDPDYLNRLPPGPDPTDFACENDTARQKLAALKQRIRQSGHPVRDNYRDAVDLGQRVLQDLTALIERLFPAGSELHPLDREVLEHAAFARERLAVYIGRDEYFHALDAFARTPADAEAPESGRGLMVLGESGSGKSALLANWLTRYRAAHPDEVVLVHHIGATPSSADGLAMLRRLLGEFQRRLSVTVEVPDDPQKLYAVFAGALYQAAARGKVVLVLDALNQLEERPGVQELAWLPPVLPANVRLIVSTLPGPSLDELQRRGWPCLTVQPLQPEERRRLIADYLAQSSKALSPERVSCIAAAEQASNPLFLRALVEELRVFGVHEKLDERIGFYLQAANLNELFARILERYEQDYERERPGLVGEALSLLWASRRGLMEDELLHLLGDAQTGEPLPQAYWAPLYLAAEHALTSRDGRLGFFHDYLRQAVQQRYLPRREQRQALHRRLAAYFAVCERNARTVDEWPWQLAQAEAWEELYRLLIDLDFLYQAWDANEFEVKAYWVRVETAISLQPIEGYRSVLEEPADHLEVLWVISRLLEEAGYSKKTVGLRRFQVEHYRQLNDLDSLHRCLGNLGVVLSGLGQLDEAIALHQEEEQLCRQLGDLEALGASLGNQARILQIRGDLDSAMVLHKEEERIFRQLGNLKGLLISLGNQALILSDRGDLVAAMALHQEEERLCHQLGNLQSLATSWGNQALILMDRGDLEGSMALHQKEEHLCRQLGNLSGLQGSLGNQARILRTRGDLDGSMALHKEEERLCRQQGDQNSLSISLSNQALILAECGELDSAMVLLKESEYVFRQLNNLEGLAVSLTNQGLVLADRGQFIEAMTLHKESERLCRHLGNLDPKQAYPSRPNRFPILASVYIS